MNPLLVDLLGDGILHHLDVSGRPLGEFSAGELYAAAGVDERPCPFHDARAATGKPINMAALRQVRRHWDDLLAALSALSALGPHRSADGHHLWRISMQARAHALCAALRFPDLPTEEFSAALFKITLGFSGVLPTLLIEIEGAADTIWLDMLPEHDFVQLLDDEGWLIGQSQVCAGSQEAIARCYLAMARAPDPVPEVDAFLLSEDLSALSLAWMNAEACLIAAACAHEERLLRGEPAQPCALASMLDQSRPRAIHLVSGLGQPSARATLALYRKGQAPQNLLDLLEALERAPSMASLDDALCQALTVPLHEVAAIVERPAGPCDPSTLERLAYVGA